VENDDGGVGATGGPLTGLRVVELAGIGPTPFAAMVLADLGAEVLRIDRPGGGALRVGDPRRDILARGRRAVAVDLKRPAGVELVLRVVERADALVEGYRPGVAERLGLGPDPCLRRNPRLVYGRMTGWGQDGPLARTAGHDIDFLAVTGVLGAIGRAGGPPQIPLNVVGDFGGGSMFLVTGLLAALWEAHRSGRGQVVDAAIVDGTAVLAALQYALRAAGQWSDRRGTNLLDGGAPFYDVYETADGEYVAVGALEPQFFAELVRGLELDTDGDLPGQEDWHRYPELRERFARRFASRTREEWEQVFAGTDACVAPVLTFGEAPHHPHLEARGTYVERDGVTQPAPAPRFSRTPPRLRRPPAVAGEHAREALRDWGIDDVADLARDGALPDDLVS
jgi:alpha-methylacyl-CoA racemase